MALSLKHLVRPHIELEQKPSAIAAREREQRIQKRKETIAQQREEQEKRSKDDKKASIMSQRRGVVDVHKVYNFLNTNKDEIAYLQKLEVQKEEKRKEKEQQKEEKELLKNENKNSENDDDKIEKKKKKKTKNKRDKSDQGEEVERETSEKAESNDRIIVHGVDVTEIRYQLDERIKELQKRQLILESGGYKRHHVNVREMEDYIPVLEDDEYDQLDENLHRKTSIAYHPQQSTSTKSSAYMNPKLAAKLQKKLDEATVENHEYILYDHHLPRRHTLGRSSDAIYPLKGYPSTLKPFENARVDHYCYDDDPMWADPLALEKERKAKREFQSKEKTFNKATKKHLKKSFGKHQPISCDSLLFKMDNIEVIDSSKYLHPNEIPSMQYDISFNDWSEHHRAGDLVAIDGKIKGQVRVGLLIPSHIVANHCIHVQLYKSQFDGSKFIGEGKFEVFGLLKAGYHKTMFVEATTVPPSLNIPSLKIILECTIFPERKKNNLQLLNRAPIFAGGSVSGKFPSALKSVDNGVIGGEREDENQDCAILRGDSLADTLSEVTGGDNKSDKTKEDLRWRMKVDRTKLNVEPAAYKSKRNISMFKEHGRVYDARHKVYADPITGREKKLFSLKNKIFG